MRKLKHYTGDAGEFMKKVVDSTKKRKEDDTAEPDNTYKKRCHAILLSNEDYIKRYKTEFDNNTLENIEGTHPVLKQDDKEDMKSLYRYKSKHIQDLNNEVLIENGYANNFCPLCGVNLCNTMDHFIPQTSYPLFVVHPLNLIPSCDTCNKEKSSIIKDGDKRKFWNVYLDTPPKEDYLLCDVKEGTGGIVDVEFGLRKGTIGDDTFRLLENTMLEAGQNVFGVFKKASGRIISRFFEKAVKHIRIVGTSKKLNECLDDLRREVDNEFEINDCESVIKKALVSSPIFVKNLKEELDRMEIKYKK